MIRKRQDEASKRILRNDLPKNRSIVFMATPGEKGGTSFSIMRTHAAEKCYLKLAESQREQTQGNSTTKRSRHLI
jgi:hypothetical protein